MEHRSKSFFLHPDMICHSVHLSCKSLTQSRFDSNGLRRDGDTTCQQRGTSGQPPEFGCYSPKSRNTTRAPSKASRQSLLSDSP